MPYLGDSELLRGDFVAVDIETTGCRPGRNGVLEIGAARIEAGKMVGLFAELVDPGEPIPPIIQSLTGITDRMVRQAPCLRDVLERFRVFAEGAVLVAHNYRFDLGFLDYFAELAWGKPFQRPVLDTLALARCLHPDVLRYNLGEMAERYGVVTRPDHRAGNDARATAELFCAMLPRLDVLGVKTAEEAAVFCGLGGQAALARKLTLTTALPDSLGLYVFCDADGRVLHLGRAKDVRVRVRSYFYGGDPVKRELAERISRVLHVACASDLDAALLESRLLARYRPAPALNKRRDATPVFLVLEGRSFPRVRVTRRRPRRGRMIGPFTNPLALQTAVRVLKEVFGLRRCKAPVTPKLALRSCAHREIETCPHPCVGDVTPEEYRSRVDRLLEAFGEGADGARSELLALQERAAAEERYEDAIRFRDGLRALERSLVSLRVVREAYERGRLVILEGDGDELVTLLVRDGYLVRSVRLKRDDVESGRAGKVLARALDRAYYDPARPMHAPRELTPRELTDIFLIASYRRQHGPKEIQVTADKDETLARLVAVARRRLRIPRKRHAARPVGLAASSSVEARRASS